MPPAPPPARATRASPPLNATAKPPAPLAPPPQGPRSRPGSVSMLRSMHCVMARGRSCQIEQRAAMRQAWRWLCTWVRFGTRWGLYSPPQRACPPTLGAHAAASPRPRAAPPLAAHPSTAAGRARVRQLPPRLARGPRAPRAARRSRARRARAPPQGPNQGRKRTAGRRRATRAATHGTAGVARGAARGVGRPPPRSPASAPSACAGREPPRRRPPARPVGVPTRRRAPAPAPAPTPPSRLPRRRASSAPRLPASPGSAHAHRARALARQPAGKKETKKILYKPSFIVFGLTLIPITTFACLLMYTRLVWSLLWYRMVVARWSCSASPPVRWQRRWRRPRASGTADAAPAAGCVGRACRARAGAAAG